MPFFIDPNDLQNDDFQLTDENGDLILTHKATGATFKYDATDGGWIPSDQFGTAANPVPGTSQFTNVEADSATINGTVDANTVEAEAVNRGIEFGTTNLTTGVTEIVYSASGVQRRIQTNDNIGTTATEVINIDNLNGYNNIKAGRGVVYGSDNIDPATTFTDFLIWTRAGSVTQVASSDRGSTDARSYAIDASGIKLSFASDDYAVDIDVTGSQF